MRHYLYLATAIPMLMLTACDDDQANDASNTMNNDADPVVERMNDEFILDGSAEENPTNPDDPGSVVADGDLPALIPPAPGEEGGLPDDRAPLDESPIDPASIRGAGSVVEQYGLALEQGDFAQAYGMWRGDGEASGMSLDAFKQAFDKYSEIHVLVGRAQSEDGEAYSRAMVPTQIYGRSAKTRTPFNLYGMIFLTPAEGSWGIVDSDLQPRGIVRVQGEEIPMSNEIEGAGTNLIPVVFQGKWAPDLESCNFEDEPLTITVMGDRVLYKEVIADVKSVQVDNTELNFSAVFTDTVEGEGWSRSEMFSFSDDFQSLTVQDGTTRYRCP